ncbi:serine/threonine protein kinase [Apiospora arundinis]
MQNNYKADDVEDIREYVRGGYAVVKIGQVLGKKYEVVDKLGYGDSATVWLCWIKGTFPPKMEWVTVKVFKSKYATGTSHELKKKKELISKGGWEREWAASHVGMPIEEFHHAGPNGLHRCLVMPLLGPSLESLDVQDQPTLKKYLYQTALALQYLHRYNVAHGAVEPRNIRFQLDLGDANIYMTVQMKVFLGLEARKRRTRAKTSDSVPSELICPADLRKLSPKGKIVLFPPNRAEFADDVPRWYQAPEILTGLKKGPGGDVWSFCCTILEVYAKCSLGLTDISSEAQLMEHVKILERFLGPLRPPSGHEVDDDGNVVRLIPPRRMCETEEEYEKWKRYACVPPWTSSPMKALLGSDWFRKHFAPKPVQPEGALPELEAGELGMLLESALCYDEPKRPYKYAKEDAEVGEQKNDTLSEAESLATVQDEHRSKPKKVVNPLLEIPLDKELDLDVLLRLTHDVKVSVEKEYILGREDLGHRSSPEWKVEDAKHELEGARNRSLTRRNPLKHYILNVCRAYRDHCDWAIVRVKLLSLRARDADLYDNDTYWCKLTMKQIKKVLEEHAQYREARLEFYRQEIRNTSSVKLRMDMVLEFPDVQGVN